jgi:putative DNA primase/helicase
MTEAILSFLAAMASAGVSPLEPISAALAGGELVRFRADGDKPGRKNGWAILHLDGLPAGVFGHYRLGVRSSWRGGAVQSLSCAENQTIKRRIADTEAKRRADMEAAAIASARDWRDASRNSAAHPYLIAKGLRSFGVRQSDADLLVPMVDQSFHLWSMQRIGPNGFKLFAKGGRTAGLFWPHGVYCSDGRPANGPLVIGEGYATMAAIHEATGFGVAAAMSAKNLLSVALAMRRAFPTREIVIAADHDGHLPRNIGLEAAQEAVQRVGGFLAVPVAVGAGSDSASRGIDFADISRADAGALIELARAGKVVEHG